MIYNNVLEAVGNTPVIRLSKLTSADDAEVLVKYEAVNIGGSIKTRTALNMINEAEKMGLITPGKSIIVEPTSGNQGVGIALTGAVKGYKVIIIMPDSVSEERRKLVLQYGADVILVEDNGNIGDCIEGCLNKAYNLAEENPDVYIPQQFTNPNNPLVHKNQTAAEILHQVDKPIHGFCSGIGTGGSLTGIGEVLKAKYPHMVIWALEPDNAAILLDRPIGSHIQMGIGDGFIPENLNREIYDEVHTVTDEEAVATAKALAKSEGILCGISGGSNVFIALKMAKMLGKGKTVVTVIPDTGERYFSTPLFQ